MPSLNREAEKIFCIRKKTIRAKNRLTRRLLTYRYNYLCTKAHCFIPLKTSFQDMPTFPHGVSGLFFSQDAVIGKNVTIFPGVIIGSNNLKDSKHRGAPTIGNNVVIGAGSVIIGKCTIGDNVRIGANTTVVKDVPPDSVVCGAPVRVIQKDNLDNEFICR